MLSRSFYSAISYAAAVLVLSGQVVAAPAEVSGENPPSTYVSVASGDVYSNHQVLAYNDRFANVPTRVVIAPTLPPQNPAGLSGTVGYDPDLQDTLELKMRAELNALIELTSP